MLFSAVFVASFVLCCSGSPLPMPAPLRKVLLVDDEPLVSSILQRTLEPAGFEVTLATNGEDGLRLFQSGEWSLVITDREPKMNGAEMATAIRKIAPSVPILLITGTSGASAPPGLFNLVVRKPFSPSQLLAQLAAILRPAGSRDDI